jgi:hypothetical protein
MIGSMITSNVFGKESYYVNRVIALTPSSTVCPQIEFRYRIRKLTKCSVRRYARAVELPRSMMDMNSTTKRLSYNVPLRWTTCIICEKTIMTSGILRQS